VGQNQGPITSSYYNYQTSGQSDNDGRGEPRTTAEMKTQSTFEGWDFGNIWMIDEGNDYPRFLTGVGDSDRDGLKDDVDNCPAVYNPPIGGFSNTQEITVSAGFVDASVQPMIVDVPQEKAFDLSGNGDNVWYVYANAGFDVYIVGDAMGVNSVLGTGLTGGEIEFSRTTCADSSDETFAQGDPTFGSNRLFVWGEMLGVSVPESVCARLASDHSKMWQLDIPAYNNDALAITASEYSAGSQLDEDGDGVGDACDNCPAVYNPPMGGLSNAQETTASANSVDARADPYIVDILQDRAMDLGDGANIFYTMDIFNGYNLYIVSDAMFINSQLGTAFAGKDIEFSQTACADSSDETFAQGDPTIGSNRLFVWGPILGIPVPEKVCVRLMNDHSKMWQLDISGANDSAITMTKYDYSDANSQADSNGNGIGDACDTCTDADSDSDGVVDCLDNCPAVYNPEIHDTVEVTTMNSFSDYFVTQEESFMIDENVPAWYLNIPAGMVVNVAFNAISDAPFLSENGLPVSGPVVEFAKMPCHGATFVNTDIYFGTNEAVSWPNELTGDVFCARLAGDNSKLWQIEVMASDSSAMKFSVSKFGQADSDGNGVGDACEGTVTCTDADSDGYGAIGSVGCTYEGIDCNDNNAAINPGASDASCNGIDENCNNVADEDYVSTVTSCGVDMCANTGQMICANGLESNTCTPTPEQTVYFDSDGDLYGNIWKTLNVCTIPSEYVLNSGDCNDNDASVNPEAQDICDINHNVVNKDCNAGNHDALDCTDMCGDLDGDGYVTADQWSKWNGFIPTVVCPWVVDQGDCNDNSAAVSPIATEVCDGLDNNCDAVIDNSALDSDSDGVKECQDQCAGTTSDAGMVLSPNNYADINGDGKFEWNAGSSSKPSIIASSVTLKNTYGCSCTQLLSYKPGKDSGELKSGCTGGPNGTGKAGTLDLWITQKGWATSVFYKK